MKHLLKGWKLGEPSYFVIWLTLWHGTQVMSLNQAWTTLDCFLACLPTQIGLFDHLFCRKNKFWCVILFSGLCRASWEPSVSCCNEKSGLRRGRKKQPSAWSILNINNFEGKVKIKFVFTFYFASFWPIQHIEILYFW